MDDEMRKLVLAELARREEARRLAERPSEDQLITQEDVLQRCGTAGLSEECLTPKEKQIAVGLLREGWMSVFYKDGKIHYQINKLRSEKRFAVSEDYKVRKTYGVDLTQAQDRGMGKIRWRSEEENPFDNSGKF